VSLLSVFLYLFFWFLLFPSYLSGPLSFSFESGMISDTDLDLNSLPENGRGPLKAPNLFCAAGWASTQTYMMGAQNGRERRKGDAGWSSWLGSGGTPYGHARYVYEGYKM